tara:strand:- start:165 stop:443 length:279 start_codon:yes stop_codon:yes gene_type:complete
MSRYDDVHIVRKKNGDGRKQLSTKILKKVPKTSNDLFILTQAGDRLDLLADQFYGNSELWWYIAQTNSISTMNLEPGTSLRIAPLFKAVSGR